MRSALLVGLLTACLASAQGPVSNTLPIHPSNEGTLTVKVDPQPQKPPISSFAEHVSAVAELARALAWPTLFGIIVITQRHTLGRLIGALTELVQYSNHVKIGSMIDVEVDRSAKEAESRTTPAVEATPKEIEAAARVGRIAEISDPSAIRDRMLEFAREYEATRSNMGSGPNRTRAMNAIVAKMRTLGIAAAPLLREFARDKQSPGKRLAALAILQLAPDLGYIDWVVDRMRLEQPFLLFHAGLVLLAMVRYYGAHSRTELEAAVRRSLDIVQSFEGGSPDRNTIDTLQQAQSELRSMRHEGQRIAHSDA